MKENEKLVLSQLVLAYQNIKNYNEIDMNADILVSYFEYTLKRNDINPKPAPIKDEEDEVVAYDYPPDFHYLFSDIKAVCEKYDPEYQPQKCKEYITSIFTSYTRKYYTDTDLKFFNDHSLEGVLEQSKIKKDWEIKFLAMNNAKNKFLKLKVVKKLVGKNAKNQSEHNNADSLNF